MTDDFYIPPVKQSPQIEPTVEEKHNQNKIFAGAILAMTTTLALMILSNPEVLFDTSLFANKLGEIGGPIFAGFITYLIITGK